MVKVLVIWDLEIFFDIMNFMHSLSYHFYWFDYHIAFQDKSRFNITLVDLMTHILENQESYIFIIFAWRLCATNRNPRFTF